MSAYLRPPAAGDPCNKVAQRQFGGIGEASNNLVVDGDFIFATAESAKHQCLVEERSDKHLARG
jgi:hypothetical protein